MNTPTQKGRHTAHTPVPWRVGIRDELDNTLSIDAGRVGPKANFVARVLPQPFYTQGEQDANAAFIVQACNAHEALVEVCEGLLDLIDVDETLLAIILRRKAEAALKLARGEGL